MCLTFSLNIPHSSDMPYIRKDFDPTAPGLKGLEWDSAELRMVGHHCTGVNCRSFTCSIVTCDIAARVGMHEQTRKRTGGTCNANQPSVCSIKYSL